MRKCGYTVPLALASLLATTLGLAGCADRTPDRHPLGWTSTDAQMMHPISVEQAPASLRLEHGPNGLSRDQQFAAREFILRYKRAGSGQLSITAVGGNAQPVGSRLAQSQTMRLVEHERIPLEAVLQRNWGGHQPRIEMSFVEYASARAPDCGYWPDNLAEDRYNEAYWNFGCAYQRNMAMSAANPRDLLGPRPQDARSSERRDTAWKKYTTGERTDSKQAESEKSSTISDIAQ